MDGANALKKKKKEKKNHWFGFKQEVINDPEHAGQYLSMDTMH